MQIHAFVNIGRPVNANGQIFRHLARFNGINARLFERQREMLQLRCVVEFRTMCQSSRPRVYRSNRIGRCWLSLLMLPIRTNCSFVIFLFAFSAIRHIAMALTGNVLLRCHVPLLIQWFCHRGRLEPMSSVPMSQNLVRQYPTARRRHNFCMPK